MACLVSEVKTSSPSVAVGPHLAGERVDHLGVEVVLPDVQAVLGLHAFLRHARAHHLGQAVDVGGVDTEPGFHLGAHLVGPRLGAEDAEPQRGCGRVVALALHFVDDREHVGRGHHDDVRAEVPDQGDLPFGHPAGDRHHRAAELLRAVVRAQPAGEQPVPVGVVQDVAGTAARGPDRAGHHRGPHLDVVAGVADHGGPAGGARGGVDPHHLLARYREHAERVVLAQVGLAGQRVLGQVGQVLAVVRVHPGGVEGRAGSAARWRRHAAASSAAGPAAARAAHRPTPARWARGRPMATSRPACPELLARRRRSPR